MKKFDSKDLKIFEEEFSDFLPKDIIDFHVHLWSKKFLKETISEKRIEKIPVLDLDLINKSTFEDFKEFTGKVFPSKKYNGFFLDYP